MLAILADDGIKLPYHVATLDPLWFEIAAELGRPRTLFKRKIKLMNFVSGHHIICVEARDKTEETIGMAASMDAMGAVSMSIASDEED
jgi:hypothetical protein